MRNLARESLLPPTPPTTNPWDLNFLSHILHTLTQKGTYSSEQYTDCVSAE